MATERAKLKAEIKKLKKDLIKNAASVADSDSVNFSDVTLITGILARLVDTQKDLNATYQALDERTILERVAKRRKNVSI